MNRLFYNFFVVFQFFASFSVHAQTKSIPSFALNSLESALQDLAQSTYSRQAEIYLKAQSLVSQGNPEENQNRRWFILITLRQLIEKTSSDYFQHTVLPAYNEAIQVYTRPTKNGALRSTSIADFRGTLYETPALHLLHVSLGVTKEHVNNEVQHEVIEKLQNAIVYRLQGDMSLWTSFFGSRESHESFRNWLEYINQNPRYIKIVSFINSLMSLLEPEESAR